MLELFVALQQLQHANLLACSKNLGFFQDECMLVNKIPHKCEVVNYACMRCASNQSLPLALNFTNQFRELSTFQNHVAHPL